MNRFPFLIALLVCAAMCSVTSARQELRPNIILIVADDLGYADTGFQGISKDVKTPNIDSIAANGVRFTNGYVSCPVCSPTRAGLMTGRYQQRFGHEFNPGPAEAENFGLPTDQVTIAQALKSVGYATGMVGKWHLGFTPDKHPLSRGFDEYFGFLAGAHMYNGVGEGKNAMLRGEKPVDSIDYLTDAFGREASSFVDRHGAAAASGAKPFFLYLPFNAVHTPQEAPKKYLDRFADVSDPKRKMMLAMLSAMDDAVGQVLDKVREHNLERTTLIIFHTDNGGPTPGNGSRNDPLRGTKGTVFEGGVRVPFAMQWKNKLPAGKVYDKPVIALDVFPTALAAANAPPPKAVKLDGVDLMPFLLGKSEGMPHQQLFWRFGAQWAIRDGDYKLVHSRGEAAVQLYDLAADIGEKSDLASSKPEIVKKLQAEYDAWSGQMEKPRWRDTRDVRREAGGGGGGGGRRRQQRAGAATSPAAPQE